MTRKFSFKFKRMTSLLLILAGVLSAVMLIYNIYQLGQNRMGVGIVSQIVFIVLSAILFAAVLLILLLSKYRLKDRVIKVSIAFIPTLSIPFSSIAKFVIYQKSEEFFIILKKEEEMRTHMLCLSPEDASRLMDYVNEIYPDIPREKLSETKSDPSA